MLKVSLTVNPLAAESATAAEAVAGSKSRNKARVFITVSVLDDLPGTINSYMSRYDAVLLISFGGPEKREDVIPFLENVLRGRNVPRERLLAVAEHYYHFAGRSPINDQNRELMAALREVVTIPVYWGNRN